MMPDEAKRYKDRGNAAFKEQNWEEAIFNYTKSLSIDDTSYINYSNRSAAYLKAGDYERALEDANTCISLKRDYAKGYGRKGSAYHAMKKYSNAISVYRDGLKVCHDDPHLQRGLAAAKNAKIETTKARKTLQKAKGTAKASQQRHLKARKAKTVSSFVEQTRRELKLQMTAIQAQLDLIDELAQMTDEEKLDLLFSLIDRDGDGTIDASELATALRKRNQDLSLKESLDRAIDMVAIFDTDGDAKLDYDEFQNFIHVMLKELGIDFHEFSEFLVLQILFKEQDETEDYLSQFGDGSTVATCDESLHLQVKQREELFDMLTDKRMMDLFMLFDKDGSRSLSFVDVAVGLYQMSLEMASAVQKTLELLLMMDPRDQRTLNYEQFGRLIMAIVAAADSTFDDISDDMMIALTRNVPVHPSNLTVLLVTPDMREAAASLQTVSDTGSVGSRTSHQTPMTALAYGRLQKLFDLWDIDGNGDISLDELYVGIQNFQDAAGLTGVNAQEEARVLLGFDEDGDNQLDRREFAKAMVYYAQAYRVDLQEFIDFMCVTTVGKNTENFQTAYGKALVVGNVPKLKPANMDYVDAWND